MDRLPRSFVACGLGLLLTSAGCKATRPEVPPGRQFTKDGQQRPAITFSSDGHPASAAASTNFMPNNLGGSNLASGIGSGGSRPDGAAFGAPPGSYGPPGTAGAGQPPNLTDPATSRASNPPAGMLPPLDSPPVPDLNVNQPPSARPVPNQVIQAPMDKPGSMGTPDQMPSPM
jgi:hypothetical protein